jgi:hypothetical protein
MTIRANQAGKAVGATSDSDAPTRRQRRTPGHAAVAPIDATDLAQHHVEAPGILRDLEGTRTAPIDDTLGGDVPMAGTPCPTCGFVPRAASPELLVLAAMRIPGQCRSMLARYGPLEAIDDWLRTRCGPSGWSALERLVQVADGLHASARAAVVLLDGLDDRYPRARADAPRAGSNTWPVQAVLGSLHAGAADLGRALSSCDPGAWDHPHLVRGGAITLRELVEDTLHDAEHHLADIDTSLATRCHLVDGSMRPTARHERGMIRA